jgi:hypothetical protein
MAAEAPAWVVAGRMAAEAPARVAVGRMAAQAPLACTALRAVIRDPGPIIGGRVRGLAMVTIAIIGRPTGVAPAGLACGHLMAGNPSGFAHRTDTGTAILARTIGTAIVRTTDIGTAAIMAGPTDVAEAVAEPNDNAARPRGSPVRRAGEPLRFDSR